MYKVRNLLFVIFVPIVIGVFSQSVVAVSRTNTLFVPDGIAPLGTEIYTSISMDHSNAAVDSFSFAVVFDPDDIGNLDWDSGPLTSDFETFQVTDAVPGRLEVTASGSVPIPAGSSGSVMMFAFSIETSFTYVYVEDLGGDFTGWSTQAGEMTGCVPEMSWLDRNLPNTCPPGEPFTVHYDQEGGDAQIQLTVETVPVGWTVLEPSWDDEYGGHSYVWYDDISYMVVLPPADAPTGYYNFEGYTESTHWCNGEVQHGITGDVSVHLVHYPTPTPVPCVHSGDVDATGTITPEDALAAFHIYLGINIEPTHTELCAADCNGNDIVSPSDALCIFKNYLSGACQCEDTPV